MMSRELQEQAYELGLIPFVPTRSLQHAEASAWLVGGDSADEANAALVRLEKKLARDPYSILNPTEVRVLDREVQRALVSSFPGLEARILAHGEDSTRRHALGARCRQARGALGIRDVSVALGISQYRLRAIEGGLLEEFRAELARRYFHFLGIDEWVAD